MTTLKYLLVGLWLELLLPAMLFPFWLLAIIVVVPVIFVWEWVEELADSGKEYCNRQSVEQSPFGYAPDDSLDAVLDELLDNE